MADRTRLALARLTPRAPDPRAPVGGGAPAWSPADIAAALGFVTRAGPEGARLPDRPAQGLLLYLWAGHDTDRERETLLLHLAGEATLWLPPGWKPERPGQLRRLIGITLDERRAGRVCRHCAGAGEVLAEGARTPCPACAGLGWRPWGARLLAERFGVTRHAWQARWAGPYARMAQMLEAVEGRGLAAVGRAMGG
jgi:hypothetical protein